MSSSSAIEISTLDVNKIFCGPPEKNDKTGQMNVPISFTEHSFGPSTRLQFQFGKSKDTMLTVPFGFGKQPQDPLRLTLDIVPDADMEEKLMELDNFVAHYVSANSQALFKTATCNKIHCPCIVRKEDKGLVLARVKVIKPGSTGNPTRVWKLSDDMTKMCPSTADEIGYGSKVMLQVTTMGIWWNSGQYGLSFKASDIVVSCKPIKTIQDRFLGLGGVTLVEDDVDTMDDTS